VSIFLIRIWSEIVCKIIWFTSFFYRICNSFNGIIRHEFISTKHFSYCTLFKFLLFMFVHNIFNSGDYFARATNTESSSRNRRILRKSFCESSDLPSELFEWLDRGTRCCTHSLSSHKCHPDKYERDDVDNNRTKEISCSAESRLHS
jgi:NADH:ubiquinone oxidoreductase subunit